MACSKIEKVAQASGTLTDRDRRDMMAVCEVAKAVMKSKLRADVEKAGGRPMLNVKTSDSTPMALKVQSTESLPSSSKVKSSGLECQDLLSRAQFCRYVDARGDTHTTPILQDPVNLGKGKSVARQVELLERDWEALRQVGHQGIGIEAYVVDRLNIDTYERSWRVIHKRIEQTVLPEAKRKDVETRCNEWIIVQACALHDAHNALKWAQHFSSQDRNLLRDAYVVTSALRRSMGELKRHKSEWITSRLAFHEPWDVASVDRRRDLFCALDVEPETAELICERLQLEFRDGKLLVNRELEGSAGLVEVLSAVFQSLWRFAPFTESRWLTVGTSSRAVIAAEILGLADIVGFIESRSGKMYYLAGHQRLQGEVHQFMTQAALISRVAEAAICILLEDSRVLLKYDELWEAISEELLWISDIGDGIWQDLAERCGLRWEAMRAEVIAAAHKSFHFFVRRVLWEANQYPWRLARGDVRANLEALRGEAEPVDPATSRIWMLLEIGVDMNILEAAVKLLREIPWTTMIVEQMHGCLAALHRHHPDYSPDALVSRAFVMWLRRLLPHESAREKKHNAIVASIERLMKKQPEKSAGRQIFYAKLLNLTKTNAKLAAYAWTSKEVMQRHAIVWARRSAEERRGYDILAKANAVRKHHEILEQIEHLRGMREMMDLREGSLEQYGVPITFSASAFVDADLAAMDILLERTDYTTTKVRAFREAALSTPPIRPALEDTKTEFAMARCHDLQPEWARPVAKRRDSFAGTAIAFRVDGEWVFYKFLYAVISPDVSIALCKMEPSKVYMKTPFPDGMEMAALREARITFAFSCNYADLADASMVPVCGEDDMCVLEGLQHCGGPDVVSRDDLTPFATFLAGLPEDAERREAVSKKQTATQARHAEHLIDEFPWLEAKVAEAEGYGPRPEPEVLLPVKAPLPKKARKQLAVWDLSDEQIEAAMRDLDLTRATVHAAEGAYQEDFHVKPLGSKGWTLTHKGVPVDAIQGVSDGEEAKQFLQNHGFKKTRRFEINAYGLNDACILARGWAHRCQYFYDVAKEDPQLLLTGPFTAQQVQAYKEPTELEHLAETAKGPLAKDVQRLRVMFVA